jgi:cation:H+ antiporter
MDARQQEEVFLTAAQSAFAVSILVSLSLGRWEAGLLFVLFAVQFAVPNQEVRIGIAIMYLVLAAWILFRGRHELPHLWHSAREAARGGGHGPIEPRPLPEPGGK